MLNDVVRNTNVTGGILTQLPLLRHIVPGLIGFTLLNQRQTRIAQFFKVTLRTLGFIQLLLCTHMCLCVCIYIVFQSEIARHKRTRMHGEFRDFIDVYLAEMNAKQSKPIVSYFDGTKLLR